MSSLNGFNNDQRRARTRGTHDTGPDFQLDDIQHHHRRTAGDDPDNIGGQRFQCAYLSANLCIAIIDVGLSGLVQVRDHILNEVRAINHEIDIIHEDLRQLSNLRSRYLAATDTSTTASLQSQVEQHCDKIIAKYRGLVGRVSRIKSDPESQNHRNSAQVHRVDQNLKACIKHLQQLEYAYQKSVQTQLARQYRIVMPNATDAEVQNAVEDGGNQRVFSLAHVFVNSVQAQCAVQKVRGRHEEIQEIQRRMMVLMLLFEDLESLVVQQQPAVISIEHKSNEVNDLVQDANTELDGGVKKARAARKKKWYCLGICGKLQRENCGYFLLLIRFSLPRHHRGGCNLVRGQEVSKAQPFCSPFLLIMVLETTKNASSGTITIWHQISDSRKIRILPSGAWEHSQRRFENTVLPDCNDCVDSERPGEKAEEPGELIRHPRQCSGSRAHQKVQLGVLTSSYNITNVFAF